MPAFLGAWMLIAIVAASMSTGDGSILAMGTCFSHNILRKFMPFPDEKLLVITRGAPRPLCPPRSSPALSDLQPLRTSFPLPKARTTPHPARIVTPDRIVYATVSTIFWTILSIAIAMAVPDQTGLLLIVAFDIMLAGSVIPLFAAVYWPKCKPISGKLLFNSRNAVAAHASSAAHALSPRPGTLAALCAILAGSFSRLILEFALPKDRLLLLVGQFAVSFGAGIYDPDDLGEFLTGDPDKMNAVCPQHKLEDMSGVDSLVAPAICGLTLVIVQLLPWDPKGWWLTPVPPPEDEDIKIKGGGVEVPEKPSSTA